ncbi:MAG: thioredoxin family protein [Sphingobium sp.]|nr:thioredoxin family protein [Sphingobium sp.]
MRALNHVFVTLLAALLAFVGITAANAQPLGGGPPHIHASLIAETMQPAPGSKVTLALLMQPEKTWHGYWDNPGDAGQGLRIDWNLPGEVTATPFRYPVPQRLLIAGLMNHVYEHDYALLFDLTIPPDAKPGQTLAISGKARWLACTDSICVPEQGVVDIALTVGNGVVSPQDRARFDGWRAQLPRPLDQPATYERKGDRISFAIPYPAGAPVAAPWFFAETQNRVRYAEPQITRRRDDMLIVETKVAEGAPDSGPIDGVLVVTPDVALQIAATAGEVPSGGQIIGPAPANTAGYEFSLTGFLLTLGGALLGGLILNIMPCVFPILSLKAISLAKAGGDERKARSEALAYTFGILVTCLALGALMLGLKAAGTQVGWAFQLQEPRVIALLLILMVAITLNLAGLFELSVIAAGQGKASQGGRAGAFWTGALAAFVATPCSGPFMATAMGAALVLPWPLALTVFAGLALGLASPFLAIAYVPSLRRLMPRPGAWMATFRLIMAVPMGLTALALLWLLSRQLGTGGIVLGAALALVTALLLWFVGKAQRAGRGTSWALGGAAILALGAAAIIVPPYVRSTKVASGEGLTGIPFTQAALAQARREGKPVFLYFTADWCLTCKVNEANAIDRGDVKKAFEAVGIVTIVGDWTSSDPAITRFLEAHGRSGVPFYLYYPKGGAEPRELPQVLTPGTLTDLAKS